MDASQELFALGLCNIGNSFVQSFPGSGSLSRSAVNNSSGVRTPMGGLYTGKSQLKIIHIFIRTFESLIVYFVPCEFSKVYSLC